MTRTLPRTGGRDGIAFAATLALVAGTVALITARRKARA